MAKTMEDFEEKLGKELKRTYRNLDFVSVGYMIDDEDYFTVIIDTPYMNFKLQKEIERSFKKLRFVESSGFYDGTFEFRIADGRPSVLSNRVHECCERLSLYVEYYEENREEYED